MHPSGTFRSPVGGNVLSESRSGSVKIAFSLLDFAGFWQGFWGGARPKAFHIAQESAAPAQSAGRKI